MTFPLFNDIEIDIKFHLFLSILIMVRFSNILLQFRHDFAFLPSNFETVEMCGNTKKPMDEQKTKRKEENKGKGINAKSTVKLWRRKAKGTGFGKKDLG